MNAFLSQKALLNLETLNPLSTTIFYKGLSYPPLIAKKKKRERKEIEHWVNGQWPIVRTLISRHEHELVCGDTLHPGRS